MTGLSGKMVWTMTYALDPNLSARPTTFRNGIERLLVGFGFRLFFLVYALYVYSLFQYKTQRISKICVVIVNVSFYTFCFHLRQRSSARGTWEGSRNFWSGSCACPSTPCFPRSFAQFRGVSLPASHVLSASCDTFFYQSSFCVNIFARPPPPPLSKNERARLVITW